MDCDFGHLPPAIPVISGSYVKADAKNGNIKVRYEFR